MTATRAWISTLTLCAICMLTNDVLSAAEWTPLFNGKNLDGWVAIDGPASSWNVEDGQLFCTGQGSGWLSTDKEYDNFELDLEFRVPAGGNSGVFLRAPHKGNPAFEGMEIQVLDDYDARYANLKPTQYCGSLYDVSPATPHVSKKAGEWQKMHIICQDNHVKVSLNGTQVVDADLSAHPDKLPTHPGLKRTSGYIGLQNHGSRLDYKNVRIRAL